MHLFRTKRVESCKISPKQINKKRFTCLFYNIIYLVTSELQPPPHQINYYLTLIKPLISIIQWSAKVALTTLTTRGIRLESQSPAGTHSAAAASKISSPHQRRSTSQSRISPSSPQLKSHQVEPDPSIITATMDRVAHRRTTIQEIKERRTRSFVWSAKYSFRTLKVPRSSLLIEHSCSSAKTRWEWEQQAGQTQGRALPRVSKRSSLKILLLRRCPSETASSQHSTLACRYLCARLMIKRLKHFVTWTRSYSAQTAS